jgi:hypothetical protein
MSEIETGNKPHCLLYNESGAGLEEAQPGHLWDMLRENELTGPTSRRRARYPCIDLGVVLSLYDWWPPVMYRIRIDAYLQGRLG